jgi:hypothetical protein
MKKKILFIQPFYFFYGHYYGLFNNLVDNLCKIKDLDFLVSINLKIKNSDFIMGLRGIQKKAQVFTFKSAKKSESKQNVIKAFFKIVKLRKNYDIFFFYDSDIPTISILYFFFWPLLYKKKIILYVFYGPEKFNKSIIKRLLIKFFLKFKNNRIFTRTKYLSFSWQNFFLNNRNISNLGSCDYPNVIIRKNKKKGKLKFGVVGQIRFGKSIEFLSDFFIKNKTQGSFYLIGNFSKDQLKKKFEFINKKNLFKENFHSPKKNSNKILSLDYLCLMYDDFFDHRQDISTLYLAAKIRSPIICFNKSGWLLDKVKKYNCGLILNSVKDFKNLPNRNSLRYKKFIIGLTKFDYYETGQAKVKFFYDKICNS